MNRRKHTNTAHIHNTHKESDSNMLGKRLWYEVEQLSLSDHRNSKKSAACSKHDSPTVLQRSAVCKSDCMSLLNNSMLSAADQPDNRTPDRCMDSVYRKHVVQHVLQPSGHAELPQRVPLKNMVQICHSVWNGGDDDSSSF